MAPPSPSADQARSISPKSQHADSDDAPVSIAALRSRFENMSNANSAREAVQKPPAAPKVSISRPRTPTHMSPQSTGQSIPLFLGQGGGPSKSFATSAPTSPSRLLAASQAGPTLQTSRPVSPVGEPSTVSTSPRYTETGTEEGKDRNEEDGPISVKAMKERFAAGAVAGPSKQKPVVPPKAPSLSKKTNAELANPPIVASGVGREAVLPTPDSHELRVETPASLSRSPSRTSLAIPSAPTGDDHVVRPPSRGPSPKPPEPSRSTKPPPRATPTPSSSDPFQSSVKPSETAEAEDIVPQKLAPALPVRKPSLPAAAHFDAPAPNGPPPIPGNKPSQTLPAKSGTTAAIDVPKLPERPTTQTVSKAETEAPPRLPTRRATLATEAASPPRMPPRQGNALPARPIGRSGSIVSRSTIPSLPEVDGQYQPPPPPTRASGIAYTPPRRGASGSNGAKVDDRTNGEDSQGDDEDDDEGGPAPAITTQAQRILDDYPDSTTANRRPPNFVPDVQVHPLHHIHAYAVHGRHVCTAAHHVKVYDTQMSNQAILSVDLKDTGLDFRVKEPRVTAMGFRPACKLADEGRYLWCGTKDGHLWELDIRTGEVTDTKQGVHGSAVAHILRYKQYLMTLEETGKLHVFEVDRDDENAAPSLIRTVRVSDRYTFARMVGNQLWTASAPPNRSTTNIASKGPTIRVYEPCASGSMSPVKTLYTSEWTGAVTSATIIPFRPNEVYLAHEGGYISVWDAHEYTCLQVLKISSTDILALEGVGERLWTGNRKGQIHVYDISEKPWRTTNVWTAHHEQAIHELYIDFRAIEDSGRFACWSCTKESLRAWDGLLSVDWIDQALITRQEEYCTFRDLKALVCTWNIDSAKPTDLIGENGQFLTECLTSVDSPDIIIFGFQEVIPLTDKKLTAKTLLFGSKEKSGSGDKVTMAYRHWIDKLTSALRVAMPGTTYVKIHSDNLVGLMTCIFVKSTEKENLRGLDITTVKRGIGGIYGNKGAIVARMIVDDTSLCFINVHLAAGQSAKAARNADLVGIMEDKAIFEPHDLVPFVHGGDGTGILDHEMVILNGDLNYRIDQRRENVISNVHAGEFEYLLEHDQLRKEMRTNHTFRLRSFEEAPINFAPTYKYNSGTNDYDSSEKRRIPAWCDRILYRKCPGIECINYRRYEPTVSDHKPVSAGFNMRVKAVDPLLMGKLKQELKSEWAVEEANILERIMKAMPGIL